VTTPHEPGSGRRIGRVLSLMGDLLREMGTLVQEEATPLPAPRELETVAPPAGEPPAPAATPPAATSPAGEAGLWLLVDSGEKRLALPWHWVSGTALSADGSLEALQLDDGAGEAHLTVDRLLGLWTRKEAAAWEEQVEWLGSAAAAPGPSPATRPEAAERREQRWGRRATDGPMPAPPAPPSASAPPAEDAAWMSWPEPQPSAEDEIRAKSPSVPAATEEPPAPPADPGAERRAEEHRVASERPWVHPLPVEGESRAAPAPAPGPAAPEPVSSCGDGKPRAERVWIVSPSALARRFLMRHLCDLGIDVLEARDLDDPLLPADLRGVRALFLDESLLEDWKARPASTRGAPPLVCLTVDGALGVPAEGTAPPGGATLPRPFERSEVERVVQWLRSLRAGSPRGRTGDDGEEDDTWLFADPFGAARAGEHSCR
jgi:hypothetical protein